MIFEPLVYFGSTNAKIIRIIETKKLIVKVATGKGIVDVRVNTYYGNSNTKKFEYLEPIIQNIIPDSGSINTLVYIKGKNFGIYNSRFTHSGELPNSPVDNIISWIEIKLLLKYHRIMDQEKKWSLL